MEAGAAPQTVTKKPEATAALRRIYASLPARRKGQLWLVLALSIVGGMAELATIGAVIPFLKALGSSTAGRDGLMPATALFITAVTIAGLLKVLLAWSSQAFVQHT